MPPDPPDSPQAFARPSAATVDAVREAEESTADRPPPSRRGRLGFAIGVSLLIVAGAVVFSRSGDMADAWRSLRAAPPPLLALLVALPIVNWLLMSATFTVLTRPAADVPFREMAGLIGAAWLLNYLPMRPGLLGRVAYHKAVHGIPLGESAWVVVQNVAAGGVAIALMLLVTLGIGMSGGPAGRGGGPEAITGAIGAPASALAGRVGALKSD